MAPLRAWRPPRCPLACCAALRGRVAPAFILRPCRTESTPSPPPPPLRCPLPLPAGALISFRSAKIPIPTPSPATLPPPAPGGGLKCILDYCAVSSPFPAPSPVLAPGRLPLALWRKGQPPRLLGLPPPAPGGGIKSHHSHQKTLIVRSPCPRQPAPIFFFSSALPFVCLLCSYVAKQADFAASWSVYGCAYPVDAIVKEA